MSFEGLLRGSDPLIRIQHLTSMQKRIRIYYGLGFVNTLKDKFLRISFFLFLKLYLYCTILKREVKFTFNRYFGSIKIYKYDHTVSLTIYIS
jgi:hypothetical protein